MIYKKLKNQYCLDIVFIGDCSQEKMIELLRKNDRLKGEAKIDREAGGLFLELNHTKFPDMPTKKIIYIKNTKNIDVIVHETNHAVVNIFKEVGERIEDAHESFAYLQEDLFNQIINASNENNKKLRERKRKEKNNRAKKEQKRSNVRKTVGRKKHTKDDR